MLKSEYEFAVFEVGKYTKHLCSIFPVFIFSFYLKFGKKYC